MTWLSNWNYRKSVTLSRVSGQVTDYQMKIIVGESSGAAGANVHCEAHCKSDFSDIRFTTSDGATLLDYWIESVSGVTPNQLIIIWIKFNVIGTDSTTFYMYYGNIVAISAADGDDTFIFFDDFEYSWATQTKWGGDTVNGSITDGVFSMVGGTDTVKQVFSNIVSGRSTFAVRVYGKIKVQAGNYEVIGASISDSTHRVGVYNENNTRRIVSKNGITETVVTTNFTSNILKIWDLLIIANSQVSIFEDGVELIGSPKTTNPVNSSAMSAWFLSYTAASVCQADWILLRNYESVEPVWGSWSEEELLPMYFFSGYTYEQGSPVSRIVRIYNRSSGELISVTTSSGTGYYYLETTYSGTHCIVALDDDAGTAYNDLILGNVTPTLL